MLLKKAPKSDVYMAKSSWSWRLPHLHIARLARRDNRAESNKNIDLLKKVNTNQLGNEGFCLLTDLGVRFHGRSGIDTQTHSVHDSSYTSEA